MNKKGFTLIELLAVLVLLGIVMGITIATVSNIFGDTKKRTEEAFIATIKDAMEMYLTSNQAKNLLNSGSETRCSSTLSKSHNSSVNVYKVSTTFMSVINSEYKPITQTDLVNPANEGVPCNSADSISVNIYRDEDYVYYYSVNKSTFGCLTGTGTINNLPKGFSC